MAEGRSTTGQDLAIISNRAKGDQFSFSSTSVVIVGVKNRSYDLVRASLQLQTRS